MEHNSIVTDELGGADALIEKLTARYEDAPEEPSESEAGLNEENAPEQAAEDEGAEDENTEADGEAEETDETDESADAQEEETTEDEADEEDALKVKVKVDGDELEVPVSELKRLYGQEAALTRKAQKLAEERKAFEQLAQTQTAAYQALVQKAAEKYRQFADIDWEIARTKLSEEEFVALRQEAKEAEQDYRLLVEEGQKVAQQHQQYRMQLLQKEAEEAHRYLSEHLEGWGPEKYQQLVDYAVQMGFPKEKVLMTTSPQFFLLVDKAMKADQAQQVAVKKKKKPTVRKNLRANKAQQVDSNADKVKAARAKLRQSGDEDAAVEFLLSKWNG